MIPAFLALLSSISICLGGIAPELDCADSHLLQITTFPLEPSTLVSMSNWKSSRDLARVEPVKNITVSSLKLSIFSAVPVFGANKSYIALLTEINGDIWHPRYSESDKVLKIKLAAGAAKSLFCGGPDRSHMSGIKIRGSVLLCPWPVEEQRKKKHHIYLEDGFGKKLGSVVALQEPDMLQQQFHLMACVRDIYEGQGNGVFKQTVEWMEWSLLHGVEHFLLYTFDGSDTAVQDIYKKYLDAGVATRVHFNSQPVDPTTRQGYLSNDCLFRAKNHAQWLLTTVDVDEYIVYPGGGHFRKALDCDEILQSLGKRPDEVNSISLQRIRFARAVRSKLEISSTRREPVINRPERVPKQIVHVDFVDRVSIHHIELFDSGTRELGVKPEVAIVHHYRMPYTLNASVDYNNLDFVDKAAALEDTSLVPDVPKSKAAIRQRFGLKGEENLKDFLQRLSQRHVVPK